MIHVPLCGLISEKLQVHVAPSLILRKVMERIHMGLFRTSDFGPPSLNSDNAGEKELTPGVNNSMFIPQLLLRRRCSVVCIKYS